VSADGRRPLLAEVVAAADPSLAPYARPVGSGSPVASSPPDAAAPPAAGPPVRDPARAFVVEAVREGYLLHYGEPRAFAGMDGDLRLLAGDSLYALGLARLAEAGDLDAVAELADLISLCASARAEGDESLAERLWEASTAALAGTGPGARALAVSAQAPPRPDGAQAPPRPDGD
jgi:hypothetical protein